MQDEETDNYIQELEGELQNRNRQIMGGSGSMFGGIGQENLIKYQLDLKEDLERIDHLLRGHQLIFDENGNMTYQEPKEENLKPFNEYGVQLILQIVSFYLNRNTLLSCYEEEMIAEKVYDFAIELSDLIYNKYEEMGMCSIRIDKETGKKRIIPSPEKEKLYPIIVREIVDTVHSAYLRALHGGERESLRTARMVNQNEPLNQMGGMYPQSGQQQKSFSVFKPSTWRF